MTDGKGIFGEIQLAPADPILNTTTRFNEDGDPRKINLGVGAYRTEGGKPYVLQVVKDAEAEMLSELGDKLNKEYAAIDGQVAIKAYTQHLLFGECEAITSGRIASAQALSGTGSIRLCAEFIKTYMPENFHAVWLSDPTWGNHPTIFEKGGMKTKIYPYFHKETKGFDFDGMMKALEGANAGEHVLLHACAHNPTGVDPTQEQWGQIADLMQRKGLVPIMDTAYQGYASGDLNKDAFSVRLFLEKGFEFYLCQSFAKNLGLYGERAGMIHVVCASADVAKAVLSQIKMVIRPMYSSPPIHGAHLLAKILGNPERLEAWKKELSGMADRILEVRATLRKGLEDKGAPGTWNHITDQIGMFSFTGLAAPQCERLIDKHHIYLLKSGRISLAGLNKGNIQYMIDCVDEVVRNA